MDKIIDLINGVKKVPSLLVFIVFSTCGVILFAPEEYLVILNTAKIKTEYGQYIGVCFIVFAFWFLYNVLSYLKTLIQKGFENVREGAKLKSKNLGIMNLLENFSDEEKAVLREFHFQKTQGLARGLINAPHEDNVVIGLVYSGILIEHQNAGDMRTSYYRLSEVALKNIEFSHFDLPVKPTQEQLYKLNNMRPSWTIRLNRW